MRKRSGRGICSWCGGPLDESRTFCPTCGKLVDGIPAERGGSSVIVPVPPPPGPAPSPVEPDATERMAPAHVPVAPGPPPGPGTPHLAPAPVSVQRRARPAVGSAIGLAAVGLVLGAGILWSIATSRSATPDSPTSRDAETSPTDDGDGGGPAGQPSSSRPAAGSDDEAAPERTGADDADDAEEVTELPAGTTWILVLHSTEKWRDVDEASAWADELGRGDPRVIIVDTDDYPALQPGFWAVVVPGYRSEQAARADCQASFGLPVGENCYPRLVG